MDAGLWALLRMPAFNVDDDDFLDYNDNDDSIVVVSITPFAVLALALMVVPILAVVATVLTPWVVSLIASNATSMSVFLACGGGDDGGLMEGGGCGCLVSRRHICNPLLGGGQYTSLHSKRTCETNNGGDADQMHIIADNKK